LGITEENVLEGTKILEIASSNMLGAQILAVPAETIPDTVTLKNMVLEFDRNQTNFKNWYKNM